MQQIINFELLRRLFCRSQTNNARRIRLQVTLLDIALSSMVAPSRERDIISTKIIVSATTSLFIL